MVHKNVRIMNSNNSNNRFEKIVHKSLNIDKNDNHREELSTKFSVVLTKDITSTFFLSFQTFNQLFF